MPPLSAAFTANPRTHAVLCGDVPLPDAVMDVRAVGPGDLFARQLKYGEFDVAELSMASYAIAVARGDDRWIGLPVFTTRDVFHAGILVRADGDVSTPNDLRGRRVGVLEYQQTSVVWIRGALQHEFGIAPHEMTWFMERRPEQSHGGATGFTPPPGIDLTYVAPASSLAAMLGDGTLDAILFYPSAIDEIDRKPAGHRAAMNARTLFDDPAAECTRYVAATGILPMNHGVVLRRSVLAARPELAREVYDALRASRDLVSSARAFPYGLNANADALDALLTYLHEQHLTARRLTLDELFVPESRAWQP